MIMNINKKRIILIILLVISTCLLITIYYVYSFNVPKDIKYLNDTNFYHFTPASDIDTPSIITLDLECDEKQNYSIAIMSVHQELFIYENDELVYSYTNNSPKFFSSAAESTWHIIPIDLFNDENKIEILMYSPYKNVFNYQNDVYYGSDVNLIENIIMGSVPSIFISIVVFFIGIAIIIWDIFYKPTEITNNFIFIGIFLILTSIWSFHESQRIYYTLVPKYIESFIAYICLYFMPGFFILSIFDLFNEKSKKVLKKLCIITFFNAGIAIIFHVFQIADFFMMLAILFPLIVVSFLIVIILKFKERFDKSIESSDSYLVSLVIIFTLLMFEILNFFEKNYHLTAFYVRLTLVVFTVFTFFMLFKNTIKKSKELKLAQENLILSRMNLITSKMQPHLISNTLVSIQELCYLNPSEAVDAIGDFSKYLRGNFDTLLDSNLISFTKELKYVREYIAIQKICYKDEIEYIESIQFEDFEIPPLSLQPLVENAINHGIRKREGKGFVKIETFRDSKNIIIKIIDNGVGFKTKKPLEEFSSSSFNVIYRLEKLSNAKLMVSSVKNKGVVITITIPLDKKTLGEENK